MQLCYSDCCNNWGNKLARCSGLVWSFSLLSNKCEMRILPLPSGVENGKGWLFTGLSRREKRPHSNCHHRQEGFRKHEGEFACTDTSFPAWFSFSLFWPAFVIDVFNCLDEETGSAHRPLGRSPDVTPRPVAQSPLEAHTCPSYGMGLNVLGRAFCFVRDASFECVLSVSLASIHKV